MENGVEDREVHASRLTGWALNVVGKAVALAALVAFAVGIVVAVIGAPILWGLVGLAGPVTFGVILYNSTPPYPGD